MNPRSMTALALVALGAMAACEGDSTRAVRSESAPAAPPPSAAPTADLAGRGVSARRIGASDSAAAVTEELQTLTPPAGAQARDTAPAPMLIRTGSATIEVDSLEPAVERVRLLAQQVGGFVANTVMQTGREQMRSATLELKLPAARWQQAVSGLAPIGKIEALSEHTADVGEEYVDVSARVANARRLETRLVELLARRTGKLEDVLAVERELARVREEIERYEGRLRYLRARVALSTLTVTVHEPRPIVGAYPGASVIGGAFEQAWRNFVRFVAALIASLGVLVPLALIAAAGWMVAARVRRRRTRAAPADSPNGGA